MPELEQRLRRYADAAVASSPPVTIAEVQDRARRRGTALRLLTVAALILVVLGVAALATHHEQGTHVAAQSGNDFPLTIDGHRDWTLAFLNRQLDVSDAEYRRRYSDSFVAAVPLDTFRETSTQVAAGGPWSILREVERRDDSVLVVQLGASSGEQLRLTLHRATDGRLDASTVLATVPCAAPVPPDAKLAPALQEQLGWLEALLASSRTPPTDEVAAHLAPTFLRQTGGSGSFVGILPVLRRLGPYTRRSFEGPPRELGLTARLGINTGEEARLTLEVERGGPHRISSFGIVTAQPCRE